MDNLSSPYGSENPTASGVLGASKFSNDAIMYYADESSCTLMDAKGFKVESKI